MFQELRFRLFLTRHKNATGAKELLADSDLFDEAFEHTHKTYQAAMKGKSGGKLTDFFQWLLNHKEEILAIIALFVKK